MHDRRGGKVAVSLGKATKTIPLGISSLKLPKSGPISTIFLGNIFATFLLCAISCLPSLHGPLILEKLFALDFRVFCFSKYEY